MLNRNVKGSKVVKAGIGYTVGNYLLKGINFLTVPIFTRILSTSEYGTYGIYMTYDAIISIFIAFALHSSLKNAKYKYGEEFNDYLSSILLLPIYFLCILLLFLNIFAGFFENLLDLDRLILNILLCHSFANSVVMIYNSRLGLDYRYKDFLKISFINTVCNVGLSLILIFTVFSKQKYIGRIVGSAFPLICISIYVYYKTFSSAKPRVNKTFWRFGLNYSIPIIPHGLSQVVLSSFDRIMIKSMIGISQAGIYTLGVNIESLVKVTTTSLDTVWGPWFYERMAAKDEDSIKQYSTAYAFGIFTLLSCLMIAAPEIVRIMGSEEYQDAKYVVIPLLACTYFTFLYTLPATVEYYFEKTKMIAAGTMGAAIINIVLNSICIRQYGYQAAAYTTLFSYFAYFCFHYNFAKRIANKQMFNTRAIVGFIIGIGLVAAFSLIFIDYFWIRLVVGVSFLAICVYVAFRKYRYIFAKKTEVNNEGQI